MSKSKTYYVTEDITKKDGVNVEEVDFNSPLFAIRWGDPKYKPCKEEDLDKKIKEVKEKL